MAFPSLVMASKAENSIPISVQGRQCKYTGQSVRAIPMRILTVGKTRSQGVQLIVDEYIHKLKRYCSIEDVRIRSNPKNSRKDIKAQIEHEDMAFMHLIQSEDWVVMLDEHGLDIESEQMADLIGDAGNTGASSLLFCIGGPYGHGRQLRQRANLSIKLSSLVLNHQIALVVLMEQLYRILSLIPTGKDVICPICLDFPHNGVLLQCSSYGKGCRPFVCDTDHLHSNCLDRFKTAYGMSSGSQSPSTSDASSQESVLPIMSESSGKPSCPLCRGEVTGWVIVDMVREHFNEKKRCCEEDQCAFTGTCWELQEHAQLEHPHGCPSKIDPAWQLDWENLQQSSEIIDVLSTIHAEVPLGVVLGDYVIEYGDNDTGDEFEDFPGDEGNWWTSCILYQVFDNFRASRNRRRSRASASRRESRNLSYETSVSDEGSVTSVEFADYRVDETDGEFASTIHQTRRRAGHHSSRR